MTQHRVVHFERFHQLVLLVEARHEPAEALAVLARLAADRPVELVATARAEVGGDRAEQLDQLLAGFDAARERVVVPNGAGGRAQQLGGQRVILALECAQEHAVAVGLTGVDASVAREHEHADERGETQERAESKAGKHREDPEGVCPRGTGRCPIRVACLRRSR